MDSLSDLEQKEMLKKWWNDYGKYILLAVIIGLIIGYIWRYWQQHELKKDVRASAMYQQVLLAEQKNDLTNAQQFTEILKKQFSTSNYAALATLFQARDAVRVGNLDNAYQNLQWILTYNTWKPIRQIAKIRAAHILLQQGKAQKALDLLAVIEDKSFQPLIDAAKGDAYTQLGQSTQATAAYQTAKQGLALVGAVHPVIEMKLTQ